MRTNLNLPKVGIVGGAGPMAGLQMTTHIINICQNEYACKSDADFPYIMLVNYPFAQMLTKEGRKQQDVIQRQLLECFNTFEKNEINVVTIACNTLHEFLPSLEKFSFKFVNMIEETALFLSENEIYHSLVLCTETSAMMRLHARHFPCEYPDFEKQAQVDKIIDRLLSGLYLKDDAEQLAAIVKSYEKEKPLGVILGSTELPLLINRFSLNQLGVHKSAIIDPMEIVAEEICKIVFKKT